ncbi:MAG: SIS domain-containing protein [Candidatus Omnitrophica bacterium]|nr:SIS domain-containing protein [Candidatus Omnitrophota bacterium]
MNDRTFIDSYFIDQKKILDTIAKDKIEKVIALLFEAWKEKRRIFIIGNGGSASTATHFAADLNKTSIVEGKPRFKAMALVDNVPWVSALINDEGFENLFVEQLKHFFEPGDVLIGISVHGGSGKDKAGLWSQNLLKAIQYVKDRQGVTIGLSGFDGGAMRDCADVCVIVPMNSTPHVESFHVTLEHLIVNCLKAKIQDYA